MGRTRKFLPVLRLRNYFSSPYFLYYTQVCICIIFIVIIKESQVRTFCTTLRLWARLSLSLNLSAQQVMNPNMPLASAVTPEELVRMKRLLTPFQNPRTSGSTSNLWCKMERRKLKERRWISKTREWKVKTNLSLCFPPLLVRRLREVRRPLTVRCLVFIHMVRTKPVHQTLTLVLIPMAKGIQL